jgi:hypothetical protein
MNDRFHRWSALTGIAAVILWIVGIVVREGLSDDLPDKASDEQILAWVQANANEVLTGGWLFMIGCLCFVWFVGTLRTRLHEAEGAAGTVSTIALAGGVATAAFGMLIPAADIVAAIEEEDISAATAGTLHSLGTAFFVAGELSAIVLLVAVAVLAFRTRVLPKWWAIFSVLLAIVLVIGPIGWAALIFGLPLWTIGTALFLVLGRRPASAPLAGAAS